MNFPLRPLIGTRHRVLRVLLALSSVFTGLGLVACTDAVGPEDTDFTTAFRLLSTTAAPDSIVWTFSGSSGAVAAIADQASMYSIEVHVGGRKVRKDTLKFDLRTLSIVTTHVEAWSGVDYPYIEVISKTQDAVANRLLIRYDTVSRSDAALHPWTHLGVQAFYVSRLFAGDAQFGGYPKNCPKGMDTAAVDSLILSTAVDSKDSVGRHLVTWALNWTAEQVKATYRRWLGSGRLRQGQYDTLYPFEDLPPTTTRKLAFTGTTDTTTILRGGDAVKLEGMFADDSGIVGTSIRILSTPPGEAVSDATSKFVLDTAAFPGTPQKTWDLAGRYSVKTVAASNGLYRLQMVFRDRKGQADTATYSFSVHQPGGSAIDSIAPTITPVLPASRTATVDDTTRSFLVRFGVADENLKTVTLDGDTVHLANSTVEKRVQLVEGQTVTVRIFASDSSKNSRKDSVQIFRKVAVPPKLKRLHPATGTDGVSDTTSTYAFQWQVDGADVDSVVIDTFGVLLESQNIAEKTLPLKLGGTTRVRIRVVDKLRHVVVDSLDVVRAASVPPVIARVGVPSGVVVVPDTQSYFTANWTVSDNNLAITLVQGQTASSADGKYGTTAFLKAGDTARIAVWAQDKLGSIGTDTVKVWRPDPRTPYLADIQKVQRGDSVVPLTDFVLPNVRFGRFEVTADLYAKVMKTTKTTELTGLPMVDVNIYDAMLFCNALSKSLGLDTFYVWTSKDAATGYFKDSLVPDTTRKAGVLVTRLGFRLPNDTEWQIAAGGSASRFPWGTATDTQVVDEFAVWNGASIATPGTLQPTGKGLFDMAGNVGEWVYRTEGAIGITTRRDVRGGDATSPLGGLVVYDENVEPILATSKSPLIGFRVVRVGSI